MSRTPVLSQTSVPFPCVGEQNTGLSSGWSSLVVAWGRLSHSQVCQGSVPPAHSLRVCYSSEPAHLLWVRMCLSIRLNLSEVREELGRQKSKKRNAISFLSFRLSSGRTRGFDKLDRGYSAKTQ